MIIKTVSILFILSSTLSFSQSLTDVNQFHPYPIKDKAIRATEVYGYFSGIEISLDAIIENHPNFVQKAKRIYLLYSANFGNSKQKALNYLQSRQDWREFEKELNNNFAYLKDLMFTNVIIASKEEIESYLTDLEQQLKNGFDTPIFENILSFQFQNQPHKEFSAGYTYTFNAKGHRKSKGTNWQIKIPKSWYAKEGDRPNIIQKFISECGNGTEMMLLLVKDVNDVFDLSDFEKELGDEKNDFLKEIFYSEEMILAMVPENGKLLSKQKISIALNEAVMFIYEYHTKTLDFELKMQTISYMLLVDDRLYLIQSSVSTNNIYEDLNKKMNKFKPLYMMVANSMIIEKKKEEIIYLTGTRDRKFVSVVIGNKPYHFILDTGASMSLIGKDKIKELLAFGTITSKNFLGKSKGKIADGSTVDFEVWSIPSLKIGNRTINDIIIGVIDKPNVEPLLGMDILGKLDVLKIDLANDKIYLYGQD